MAFSSDIYSISDFVNAIKKNYVENINENTLFMGTFGYLGEVFSNEIQNEIITTAEFANEAFPTRAKYDKNVITHAINLNIEKINAVPAQMNIMIGFIESDLIKLMNDNVFRIDKDAPIYIEKFEFHLDYDIIIHKETLLNNDIIYTAQYDISRNNNLSDVINPYLEPPNRLNIEGEAFILVNCKIRQLNITTTNKKIINSNIIENKTFEFDFEDQLAGFSVTSYEGDGTVVLLDPTFEGAPLDSDLYVYYSYLDDDTIRVKFDRNSYDPKINCEILLEIKTTQGSAGNFTYADNIKTSITSTKYNYSDLSTIIYPLSDSVGGEDKKSIQELKQIIPKEALARGSITSIADLNGYFNRLDTKTSRTLFYKKRDNQIERLYYAYVLMKQNNVVIPTNTVDIIVDSKDYSAIDNNRYVINPRHKIRYKANTNGFIVKDGEDYIVDDNNFLYTIPYMIIVNLDPLYVSYYLTVIDKKYTIIYDFINQGSALQFIGYNCKWKRGYIEDTDTYKLTIDIMQNINEDRGLVSVDDQGHITSHKFKVFAVFYKSNGEPYKYAEAILYNKENFTYSFQFKFKTNNIINEDNYIRIEDLYDVGTENKNYGYLKYESKVEIFVLADMGTEYGRGHKIDRIVPGLFKYSLLNSYIVDKVEFFTNYTHIISSLVTPMPDIVEDGHLVSSSRYKINAVPMVKYSYLEDQERVGTFTNLLENKREYINSALEILEDSFGVDFKFFNTYGPSKTFFLYDGTQISKVNLKFKFKVKLRTGADKYTVDYIIAEIKDYTENIYELGDIHIPNMITHLTNKFAESIVFIEYCGFDSYGADQQHINEIESDILTTVPEFLNISSNDDLTPDIQIELV